MSSTQPQAAHPPRIVLVRPLYGGNVGSSARAMCNMGLSDLRVVDRQYRDDFEAHKMAMGGQELLKQTRFCDTLAEAVSDCSTVVACTARPRAWKAWKCLDPREAASLLSEQGEAGQRTAFLFGSEDKGLNNKDLDWATHLCHIPTDRDVSSLNLSQAVLLVGWEWARSNSQLHRRPARSRKRATPPLEQVNGAADQLGSLLDRIDFFVGRNRAQALATIRQTLLRSELTDTELHFLRGVVRKLHWHVDHGERVE